MDDSTVVQKGDLVVFSVGTKRVADWATSTRFELGKTVAGVREEYPERHSLQVYRVIPVAKQGDSDSRTQTAIAQLSQEAEQEARALGDSIISTPIPSLGAATFIPQGDAERKAAPMFRGLLGYFPAALFAVAAHSQRSDQKHNPGNTTGPCWARGKSSDHADCILRHLVDSGGGEVDEADTEYHLTALAWRSLALLQEFQEKHRGARPGVRARLSSI